MKTAKKYFEELVITNKMMPENSRKECEEKMIALQFWKTTFANWWLIFWAFFGLGIGFIVCLIIGNSNKIIRSTYKSQELKRLQAKIDNFVKIEIAKMDTNN